MATVINLRRARKARARADDAAAADSARVRHGRTAAQKQAEALAAERAQRALDGCRLVEPADETHEKPDETAAI
jgi:hypothetical protein